MTRVWDPYESGISQCVRMFPLPGQVFADAALDMPLDSTICFRDQINWQNFHLTDQRNQLARLRLHKVTWRKETGSGTLICPNNTPPSLQVKCVV